MKAMTNAEMVNRTLIDLASFDKDIIVLVTDSRGSSKMTEFSKVLPEQFIEVGIAEQNIVGIAAGLASCGKKPYILSYAPFLTSRSIEQIKLDLAYSGNNVKVVGVSGGISYAELGMTHYSLQDFAYTRTIPDLNVYCPSDATETRLLIESINKENKPSYIRLGKHVVKDYYHDYINDFKLGKATLMNSGDDILLVATGEMVSVALDAAKLLEDDGIKASVLNYHSIKPFDRKSLIELTQKIKKVITIEEHSVRGGLGSLVAEELSEFTDISQKILGFPDEKIIHGSKEELLNYYGLNKENLHDTALKMLGKK